MTNIMLEIDEAMRWERMEKFWKAYGNYVVSFIALLILFTAGMEGYRAWNDHARTRDTEKLLSLIEDKNYPGNVGAADLQMRGSLKGVALLMAAGDLMRENKRKEALELYERAAQDQSISMEMRGLAILMCARLLSQDADVKEDLAQMLEPVAGDAKSPWRAYALMEAASFSASRGGDLAKARAYIKRILDIKDLPQSIYAKARALDGIYAQKESRADADKKTVRTQ